MALVAFDFDGTLSDDEMIVHLGEQVGRSDEIRAVTERAMAGELSYAESLRERVAMLEGASKDAVAAAYGRVNLRPGAAGLLADLRDADVRLVILTGGFEPGVERALEREGVQIDRIIANQLLVDENGQLSGEVEGPLIEGTKDEALVTISDAFGIELEGTVCVGDGANDVPMLQAAGTAIGFRPKPSVSEHCDIVVTSVDELRAALVDLDLLPADGA